MQFEIKVKITCAASEDFCYQRFNDDTLHIGPLPPEEIDNGQMNAIDYFYMRSSYLVKIEKLGVISACKDSHADGLKPLNEILGLSSDPSVYMDWRGIRRGLAYQILLYVYIIGDNQYQYYVDTITQILENNGTTVTSEHRIVDHSTVSISSNGIFEIESPFCDDFIRYDTPTHKYHEFFRDYEEDLHVFEKYTQNCNWASWDKDLPAEGDSTEFFGHFLAALQIIIPLFQGCIAKYRVEREKRLIRVFYHRITDLYPIQGYLVLKTKNAMSRTGKRIHIFQDKRGSRIFSEFEVEVHSGRVRRIRL